MIAYDFLCDGCGYAERVAGGRDPKRLVVTETMTCADCARLVDVLVSVRDPGRAAGPLFVCPHCGGARLSRWGKGSTLRRRGIIFPDKVWGPCPRCGSAIRTTTTSYRTD